MECTTSRLKLIMFCFNFLFVLAGIMLVVYGVFSYQNEVDPNLKDLKMFVNPPLQITPILGIVIGILVVFIAFFGCYEVTVENQRMLKTYATILFLLILLQVGVGVYIYYQTDEGLESIISNGMNQSIQSEEYIKNEDIRNAFDSVQERLKCCGANSSEDYETIFTETVPKSCCEGYNEMQDCPSNYTLLYKEGCAAKLYEATLNVTQMIRQYIFYECIALAVLELLAAIFGFCLACSIKTKVYARSIVPLYEDRRAYLSM